MGLLKGKEQRANTERLQREEPGETHRACLCQCGLREDRTKCSPPTQSPQCSLEPEVCRGHYFPLPFLGPASARGLKSRFWEQIQSSLARKLLSLHDVPLDEPRSLLLTLYNALGRTTGYARDHHGVGLIALPPIKSPSPSQPSGSPVTSCPASRCYSLCVEVVTKSRCLLKSQPASQPSPMLPPAALQKMRHSGMSFLPSSTLQTLQPRGYLHVMRDALIGPVRNSSADLIEWALGGGLAFQSQARIVQGPASKPHQDSLLIPLTCMSSKPQGLPGNIGMHCSVYRQVRSVIIKKPFIAAARESHSLSKFLGCRHRIVKAMLSSLCGKEYATCSIKIAANMIPQGEQRQGGAEMREDDLFNMGKAIRTHGQGDIFY